MKTYIRRFEDYHEARAYLLGLGFRPSRTAGLKQWSGRFASDTGMTHHWFARSYDGRTWTFTQQLTPTVTA